jgi:anti-sigma factor RsiW
LLEPAAPENSAARAHIAACAACAKDLATLQATLSLLDTWQAPEVSPYFDQKLAVRLREQSAPPAGWFERLSSRLLFNTGRHLRPALAGALALVLVVGGGSFGIANFQHPRPVEASAVVNDLQMLDKNEQALQQMDQLLDDNAPAADSGATLLRARTSSGILAVALQLPRPGGLNQVPESGL